MEDVTTNLVKVETWSEVRIDTGVNAYNNAEVVSDPELT